VEGTIGVQLSYESVTGAVGRGIPPAEGLKRFEDRKVRGFRFSGDISIAGFVDCDAVRCGCAAAAQVCHVKQRFTVVADVSDKCFVL